MKSTVFDLQFPKNAPDRWKERDVKFYIPTLKAYAIEYSEFIFKGGFGEHKEMVEGRGYTLVDDGIIWHDFFEPKFPGTDYYRLVIHYHGIKDYGLLFPHVENQLLRERLGRFYEEAEVSFENGAWLSFALMCGAIYEGLLFHYFDEKDKKFSELIGNGHEARILDDSTARIMHSTRELRNLVHASRMETSFVSRAQAMDMRTVLDRLVKNAWFWFQAKKEKSESVGAS